MMARMMRVRAKSGRTIATLIFAEVGKVEGILFVDVGPGDAVGVVLGGCTVVNPDGRVGLVRGECLSGLVATDMPDRNGGISDIFSGGFGSVDKGVIGS